MTSFCLFKSHVTTRYYLMPIFFFFLHKKQFLFWCSVTSLVSNSLRPMDCGPPGSSVNGILQARILEWVAWPPPGDPPNPGIKPRYLMPPLLADGLFTTSAIWEAIEMILLCLKTVTFFIRLCPRIDHSWPISHI